LISSWVMRAVPAPLLSLLGGGLCRWVDRRPVIMDLMILYAKRRQDLASWTSPRSHAGDFGGRKPADMISFR
jgi:hypothetical protein